MSYSLKGLGILNTRPKEQAQQLSQSIRDAGGRVIELPTLEIKASSSNWLQSLPDLKKIDQAIFISANAVHYFFKRLKQKQIYWPSSIKVIAIGQGSAAALQKLHIHVTDLPDLPDSEHLLALESLQNLKREHLLLCKGEGGRPLIETSLLKRGAYLTTLNVYQRIMPAINQQFIESIWRNDLVDIILLTSEQSLHNLFKLFSQDMHDWLRGKSWLLISKRLAEIAFSLGIKDIRISHPHKMMDTLFDYVIKD